MTDEREVVPSTYPEFKLVVMYGNAPVQIFTFYSRAGAQAAMDVIMASHEAAYCTIVDDA